MINLLYYEYWTDKQKYLYVHLKIIDKTAYILSDF